MDISIFDSIKEKIILENGEKYFKNNSIKDFDIILIDDTTINIKGNQVVDDKRYNSELIISTSKNEILSSFCTCDEMGDFCAHRAALVFKLLSISDKFLDKNKINKEKFVSLKRELAKDRLIKTLKTVSEKYSVKITIILEEKFNQEAQFKIDFYKDEKLINFYTDISYLEKWDELRQFNYTLFPLKDRLIVKAITDWLGHIPEEEFSLPKNNLDLFLKILSDFPEFYEEDSGEKLKFSEKYFKPQLTLNFTKSGAYISLDIEEDFKIFSGFFYQWILINNIIYPLRVKLSEDIWNFLSQDNLILKDNEISTFYYEILPKIQNSFKINVKGDVKLEEIKDYKYHFVFDYVDEITLYPKISLNFDINDSEGKKVKEKILFEEFTIGSPENIYICKFYQNRYLVIKRNLIKEKKILFLLKKYHFKLENKYLKQQDKLYYKKFLEEGPNILKQEVEIVFTENFKKIMLEKAYILADIKLSESTISQDHLKIKEEYIFSDGSKVTKDAIEKIVHGKRFINIKNNLTLVENYEEIKLLKQLIHDVLDKKSNTIHMSQFFYFYDEVKKIKNKSENSKISLILPEKLKKMIYLRETFVEKQDISILKTKITIPKEVSKKLRNYQKYGFFWFYFLKEFHFGGILADDMGLGKTIQILTFIKSLNSPKPSLIICPTSLLHNWENEILKFFPNMKYLIIVGNVNERKKLISHLNRYDVIITSYSLIRNDIEEYELYDFEAVVLDEANHIKNPNTKISNTVKRINSAYRFVLTGTPVENNLKELWSIFSFVSPQLLGKFKPFKENFVDNFTEEKLEELKKRISPFILRRIKKDVLPELPPKIIQTLFSDLSPIQQKLYQEILDETRESILYRIKKDGLKKSKIHILTALLKLRQISNHPSLINPAIGIGDNISGKADLLKEILIESVDSNHKILLFSQFTQMLHLIRSEIQKLGFKFSYLDGSIPENKRRIEIDKFKKEDIPIFLISLKAGGYGLNLSEADMVIIFDPWWNPMVEMQAIDRAYRMGQKNTVNVYKLISKNTIEEKILKLQEKKKQLFDSVVNVENIFNSLTEEDIEEFFQ